MVQKMIRLEILMDMKIERAGDSLFLLGTTQGAGGRMEDLLFFRGNSRRRRKDGGFAFSPVAI